MQVEIKNYRGCQSASFSVDQITLVGGRNAAGKSSLTQAVAGALSGNPLPVRGVSKSTAGQLVRSGTAAGSVWLAVDNGQAEISWPQAKLKTTGTPPQATEYAAGLSCVLNMNQKDRATVLAQYLKSEPTREDFDRELAGLKLPKELLDQLWQIIEENGWDAAHANCKEKGAKLKGQWEQITGERYGSKKADSYVPDGWEPELDGMSSDSLEADLNDAKQMLEAAIAADAVDESKREELENRASDVIGLKDQLAEYQAQAETAAASRDEARENLKALPCAEQVNPLVCPKCEAKLRHESGQLVEATILSDEEIKQRQAAISAAQAECDKLQDEMESTQQLVNNTRELLRAAQSAANELDGMDGADRGEQSDIESAREQVSHCESRLRAWKQKTEADNRHMNIGINAELVSALSADGIRRAKLAEALEVANAGMRRTGEVSQFGVVELDDGLTASLNGTPYHLLSKSERWRVRVTLQLWMAHTDGSAAVIIDGADILVDSELRNGLFAVLKALGMPALVTMALPDSSRLPDLSAAGLGASYWIEAGKLQICPA